MPSPTTRISIKVVDERNNIVKLGQAQTDASGDFEATVGPIRMTVRTLCRPNTSLPEARGRHSPSGSCNCLRPCRRQKAKPCLKPRMLCRLPAAETGDARAKSEQLRLNGRSLRTLSTIISEDWLQFLLMLETQGASVTTIALAVSIMVIRKHHNTRHHIGASPLSKLAEDARIASDTKTQACRQVHHIDCPGAAGMGDCAAGRRGRRAKRPLPPN